MDSIKFNGIFNCRNYESNRCIRNYSPKSEASDPKNLEAFQLMEAGRMKSDLSSLPGNEKSKSRK